MSDHPHTTGGTQASTGQDQRGQILRTWGGPRTELLRGTWHRDLRLGHELVGKATLAATNEGLLLSGRLTSPLRTMVWTTTSFCLTVAKLGVFLAALLTSIGVGWRAQDQTTFFVAVLVMFPLVWIAFAVARWALHRVIEPWREALLPWGSIRRFATDGAGIELLAHTTHGNLAVRLTPHKHGSAQVQGVIDAVRRGNLPSRITQDALRPMRSVWVDRAVWIGVLGIAVAAAFAVEPKISALPGRLSTPSGPAGGIPAELTEAQVEALSPTTCVRPTTGPKLTNERSGTDLKWTVTGDGTNWAVLVARWQAGGRSVEVLQSGSATNGTRTNALPNPTDLGLVVLVQANSAATATALIAARGLDGLEDAVCSGLVARFDVTTAGPPAPGPTIHAKIDGPNLIVEPSGLAQSAVILPVRVRDAPSVSGPFDLCEIPQVQGVVGAVPADPSARRFKGFFGGGTSSARVVVLRPVSGAQRDAQTAAALERLGRGGTVQPCMVIDSLAWSGLALATADVGLKSGLEQDAAIRFRERLRLSPWSDARAQFRALASAWDDVRSSSLSSADADRMRAAALDAVPWSQLFDVVGFTDLAAIDDGYRVMAATDPRMAERFLYALGEHFLERIPLTADQFESRLKVAAVWQQASTHGHAFDLVGRFVLLDLARQVEGYVNGGGLLRTLEVLPVTEELKRHKIHIAAKQSSTSKLVSHWVTGDFEYIADRALKKLSESLGEAQTSGSQYALTPRWNPDPALRDRRIMRDGREIGDLVQIDPSVVRLRYEVFGAAAGGRVADVPSDARLVAAAAYFDPEGRPDGIAIVEGEPKNDRITVDKDGLIVIVPGGGISMLDMRQGGRLPGESSPIRPLRSIRDYGHLLDWLAENRASAFQTHLLMADQELRIDPARASGETRERRLLVQGERQGQPRVAIVDLPGATGWSLSAAATIVVESIHQADVDWKVVGVANLDTGSQDVFLVEGPNGLARPTGVGFPVSQARNLLIGTR